MNFYTALWGTKEAFLEFLAKENSKFSDLRRKIIDYFSQRSPNSENDLEDIISKLDWYLDKINDFFAKISQAPKLLKSKHDPISLLLSLQPQEAIERVKLMTKDHRNWYNGVKLFYAFNQKLESLNRSFFTEICGAYLEKRNMQNTPEMHDKTGKSTSIESANVKDSISLIINENSECLKESEKESNPIKTPPENEINLLNTQMSTVSNDLNKETESASKVIETLRNKTAEILSRPNNPELEIDFRATCSAIQTNSNDPPLMQAYQYYLNAYQQKTSLYNIGKKNEFKNNLIIYNTETETKEVKTLKTPKWLGILTCITQLPNGKLFCFGSYPPSGVTVLSDVNGGVEVLPSGTPCSASSCVYFNDNVYCFGGWDEYDYGSTLSRRFDLGQNRWIQLAPMLQADYYCHSIIFNGNILISGYDNINLLLYSIDIDSFSIIPYELSERTRKILINAGRLYLIECRGWTYESEVGSYSDWRRRGKSTIDCNPNQVYCSYNKGGIYISIVEASNKEYYCFNLDQKIIIDIANYSTSVSLRRVGKKIEVTKRNSENFKLDPYYLDEYNAKDFTLKCLGENLSSIEFYGKAIKLKPNDACNYKGKGDAFYNLKRYLEAIECYDEAIKLNPIDNNLYIYKCNAFLSWQRYLEAIECYDEAIKLNPNEANFYNCKGNALSKLKRYLEAIECYDKAIKLSPNKADFYNNKGRVFYNLQRYLEAIECYDEAIKHNPGNAVFYNDKGYTFEKLERYLEAIQCFDKAIKCFNKAIKCFDKAVNFDPNADSYYKKGCSLNGLGRYSEAVESYDEAIIINPNNAKYYNGKGNTLYILERYQEAIQCYDEAIKLEPNNPLHFCCRARAFNNLRQEETALQDFNRAYSLMQENQEGGAFTGDEWKLSEEDINFINDALGRDRIELLQKMQI